MVPLAFPNNLAKKGLAAICLDSCAPTHAAGAGTIEVDLNRASADILALLLHATFAVRMLWNVAASSTRFELNYKSRGRRAPDTLR